MTAHAESGKIGGKGVPHLSDGTTMEFHSRGQAIYDIRTGKVIQLFYIQGSISAYLLLLIFLGLNKVFFRPCVWSQMDFFNNNMIIKFWHWAIFWHKVGNSINRVLAFCPVYFTHVLAIMRFSCHTWRAQPSRKVEEDGRKEKGEIEKAERKTHVRTRDHGIPKRLKKCSSKTA